MGETHYTSDLHFLHERVAGLRGFASAHEHDEAIIWNWNQVVRPVDAVWVLGDVTLKKLAFAVPLLRRLHGGLHLVAGNHDACWPGHLHAHRYQRAYLEVFATVQPFARHRIAGQDVLLSHFPYSGGGDHRGTSDYVQYRLRDEGRWLLHGHTHSGTRRAPGTRMIHIGLDAWELRPVPLHKVAQVMPG